jgi:hypothetical protein
MATLRKLSEILECPMFECYECATLSLAVVPTAGLKCIKAAYGHSTEGPVEKPKEGFPTGQRSSSRVCLSRPRARAVSPRARAEGSAPRARGRSRWRRSSSLALSRRRRRGTGHRSRSRCDALARIRRERSSPGGQRRPWPQDRRDQRQKRADDRRHAQPDFHASAST